MSPEKEVCCLSGECPIFNESLLVMFRAQLVEASNVPLMYIDTPFCEQTNARCVLDAIEDEECINIAFVPSIQWNLRIRLENCYLSIASCIEDES